MQIILILVGVLLIDLNNNLTDCSADQVVLETGWYHSNSDRNGEMRVFEYLNETMYVNPTPIVTVENFERLEINETSWAKGEFMLAIWLDKEGTKKWSDATEFAMNNRTNLVFILDNKIINAPMVFAKMTNGATAITRKDLSKKDLEEIKGKLER
ncbi:SecDF P1 head subdomain-containing protein [Fulvivirga sediminis]|uniref:SecDF P1 head subdomain domain-containing protein n=1 Tax=Fulvivirga sediminis TaxID=2803949 RepID=A0A937K3K9_9BACT|nr:hypothetical protein [Fulvivirga sediminis]MBL3659097.1 hypothetical protein [Fulvivirga sediminis]